MGNFKNNEKRDRNRRGLTSREHLLIYPFSILLSASTYVPLKTKHENRACKVIYMNKKTRRVWIVIALANGFIWAMPIGWLASNLVVGTIVGAGVFAITLMAGAMCVAASQSDQV